MYLPQFTFKNVLCKLLIKVRFAWLSKCHTGASLYEIQTLYGSVKSQMETFLVKKRLESFPGFMTHFPGFMTHTVVLNKHNYLTLNNDINLGQ